MAAARARPGASASRRGGRREVAGAFHLQFPAAELPGLAARFPASDESPTQRLGAAARTRGYYTRGEFLAVCAWKSPRSRPKVQVNRPRAVRAATSVALSPASSEQARIEALLALQGVGVPTGSTLLYMAFPAEYPILDVRALHALGQKPRSGYPVSYWLAYLDACRRIAAEHAVSLRTLDKALWQWSKEQPPIG